MVWEGTVPLCLLLEAYRSFPSICSLVQFNPRCFKGHLLADHGEIMTRGTMAALWLPQPSAHHPCISHSCPHSSPGLLWSKELADVSTTPAVSMSPHFISVDFIHKGLTANRTMGCGVGGILDSWEKSRLLADMNLAPWGQGEFPRTEAAEGCVCVSCDHAQVG